MDFVDIVNAAILGIGDPVIQVAGVAALINLLVVIWATRSQRPGLLTLATIDWMATFTLAALWWLSLQHAWAIPTIIQTVASLLMTAATLFQGRPHRAASRGPIPVQRPR